MKLEVADQKPHNTGTLEVRVQLSREQLRLTDTPYGLLAELDGFEQGGELGGPALPVRALHVALPRLTRPARVSVEVLASVPLTDRPRPLAPLQPPAPGGLPTADRSSATGKASTRRRPEKAPERVGPPPARPPALVLPREEAYARALASPPPLAELVRGRTLGLNSTAVVALRPVQLDREGRASLVTSLVVRIEYTAAERAPSRVLRAERRSPDAPAEITSRAQAERAVAIAEHQVINPELIERFDHLYPRGRADYLIITDNHRWDPALMEATGATDGNLVAAFGRLVTWKRSRGLTARLVTITDIMRDVYGQFRAGARDLQEVLRNFLKYAHQRWGTAWVLLGGDIGVVPVRRVAGLAWGQLAVSTAAAPPDWNSSWAGDHLRVQLGGTAADHIFTRADTGLLIPHDAAGTSSTTSLGWYFTTDATYATRSATPTAFIRVNGPAASINGPLHVARYENLIPTDLYYSSLVGPNYGVPGRHDWDALGNGLYGQHVEGATLDGVEYHADVSVGRAPASTGAEANAFVDKVMAYERLSAPDGTPLGDEWTQRIVFGAANWGGRIWFGAHADSPPPVNHYHHAAGAGTALLRLDSAATDVQWHLFAYVSESDVRELPYATSGRGWYFAVSATDTSPSQRFYAVSGMSFHIPVPTQWIVVRSSAAEELAPAGFILDRKEADGSMTDQEQLREQVTAELSLSKVTRLYEDDVDLTAAQRAAADVHTLTETRMRAAMSAGPHFVSLSGHGWWGGCCGVSPDLPPTLTNGYRTFVVYADSCYTNEFNHDELDGQDSVSERLVLQPGGGAVAYIGNTRFSWIGVGDNFQRAFFHRLATTRNLGAAFDVRCSMTGEWTGFYQQYNTWAIFAQNLLGCPEMPLWVGPPARIRIEVPREIPRRWPIRVPVGPDPWERRLVVTVRQGDVVREAKIGEDGAAILDLSGFSAGEVEVVASAPGHVPQVSLARLDGPTTLQGLIVGLAKALDGKIEVEVLGARLKKLALDAAAADRLGLLAALRRARAERSTVSLDVDHDDDGGRIEGVR